MAPDLSIGEAFINVASVCPRIRHGKWIPLTYWCPKVCHKLEETVEPRKLFRVLEKLHITNREFTSEEKERFGSIKMIESTERRLLTKEGSNKLSRVGFFCVATSKSSAEEIPHNQVELSKFFQARCNQHHARKSMLNPRPLVRRIDLDNAQQPTLQPVAHNQPSVLHNRMDPPIGTGEQQPTRRIDPPFAAQQQLPTRRIDPPMVQTHCLESISEPRAVAPAQLTMS